MIGLTLIMACAPQVAPATVQEIVRVESGGNPIALNINGVGKAYPVDLADAIRRAKAGIAAGHTVDMGYMQVNSRTAARLGYSIEQIFDPCTNLRAGATVLTQSYLTAVQMHGGGQRALQSALSAYNTGDFSRGFSNGYVGQYYGVMLSQPLQPFGGSSAKPVTRTTHVRAAVVSPYTAGTAVYTRQEKNDELARTGIGESSANPSAAAGVSQP